jgi:hypothetical protein
MPGMVVTFVGFFSGTGVAPVYCPNAYCADSSLPPYNPLIGLDTRCILLWTATARDSMPGMVVTFVGFFSGTGVAPVYVVIFESNFSNECWLLTSTALTERSARHHLGGSASEFACMAMATASLATIGRRSLGKPCSTPRGRWRSYLRNSVVRG